MAQSVYLTILFTAFPHHSHHCLNQRRDTMSISPLWRVEKAREGTACLGEWDDKAVRLGLGFRRRVYGKEYKIIQNIDSQLGLSLTLWGRYRIRGTSKHNFPLWSLVPHPLGPLVCCQITLGTRNLTTVLVGWLSALRWLVTFKCGYVICCFLFLAHSLNAMDFNCSHIAATGKSSSFLWLCYVSSCLYAISSLPIVSGCLLRLFLVLSYSVF